MKKNCFQRLNSINIFQDNNLKSAAMKCLEEIEANMTGILCFTSVKIFFVKH